MEPDSSKLDASVIFRFLKLVLCPLMFCAITIGGTLSQADFSWANGSYDFVFGAWIINYGFWAFFTRLETAAAGDMLDETVSEAEAREQFEGWIYNQRPITRAGRIELLVFAFFFVTAIFLPEDGFPILWWTAAHFSFVALWRTIPHRFVGD